MFIFLLILWLLSPLFLIPFSISKAAGLSNCRRFLEQLRRSGRISYEEQRLLHEIKNNDPEEAFGESLKVSAEKISSDESGQNFAGVNGAGEALTVTPDANNEESEAPARKLPESLAYPYTTGGEVSSSKVLFGIGTTLVILAGLVFSTAIWVYLSDAARMAVIALAGCLFLGISAVARKKLDLPGTSNAFYIISSVFFMTSYFTGAIYSLYGNWLSIAGDGSAMAYAIGALLLSGCGYIGRRIYKSVGYSYLSYFSAAAAATFLIVQMSDSFSVFVLLSTLFGTAATAAYYEVCGRDFRKPLGITILSARVCYAFAALILWQLELADIWSAYTVIVLALSLAELLFYAVKMSNKLVNAAAFVIPAFAYEISEIISDKLNIQTAMLMTLLLTASIFALRSVKSLYGAFSDFILFASASIAALVSISVEFLPYGLISMLAVELVLAVTAARFASYFRTASFILLPLPLSIISLFTADSFRSAEMQGTVFSVAASVTVIVFALCAILFKFLTKYDNFCKYSAISFELFACNFALISSFSSNTASAFILSLITSIALTFEICRNPVNVHSIFPVISAFAAVRGLILALELDESGEGSAIFMTSLALFLASTVCSRIFCGEKCICHEEKTFKADIFLVCAILSGLLMLRCYTISDDLKIFVILTQIAIIFANCIRKEQEFSTNRIMAGISLASAAVALMNRTSAVIEDEIAAPKVVMLIILGFGISLRKLRCGGKPIAEKLGIAVYIFDYIVLMYDALVNETLFNTLLVLCVSLVILIYSFMAKRKGSFIISGVGLVGLTLYIMRDFLAEIDWWIYLLLAGILLISIAGINEYCKGREDSFKAKAGRFFEDWKW